MSATSRGIAAANPAERAYESRVDGRITVPVPTEPACESESGRQISRLKPYSARWTWSPGADSSASAASSTT